MPPSKKSEERVGILLECLESGMPVKNACQFAQIHKDSYYEWYNSDESFRLKADYAKSAAIRKLIVKQVDKDPWKLLKSLDNESFRDEENVNMEVKVPDYTGIDDEFIRSKLRKG